MGIIIGIMEKNMETTIQYVGVTWGLYTDNGTIMGILIISRPSKGWVYIRALDLWLCP